MIIIAAKWTRWLS